LFAARLSAIGVDVTLLGSWQDGLRALREGVRLEENGEETIYPVRATDQPSGCFGMRYALVLVKAWQTERAARQLGMCLAPDGVALTLQNGYGNREILAKSLGANNVALGVTTTGATLTGPGRVRPGGQGTLSLESHSRLELIIPLLREAGFVVQETPNADSLVWSKLVINAAINPLTALIRIPNGELLERPSARALLADLAREAAAVAAALNIPLTFTDPVAAAEDVARRTATNHSSMYQDIQRGAPTEIDAICGAVVRVGEEVGVATPVNRVMWGLVRAGGGG
jgi:2-dehydropantoate 2-reductase